MIKFLKYVLIVFTLLLFVPRSDAQRSYHYRGGNWSHSYHRGWHRYYGGPSIGFYWAISPVYIVPGYDDPVYYVGPNSLLGVNINLGGGGGYAHGGGYHGNHRTHNSHTSHSHIGSGHNNFGGKRR